MASARSFDIRIGARSNGGDGPSAPEFSPQPDKPSSDMIAAEM
jgi:hypothetical protein